MGKGRLVESEIQLTFSITSDEKPIPSLVMENRPS